MPFLRYLLGAVLLVPALSGCGLLVPGPDERAPFVEILRPGEGAVVGGDVIIRARARAVGDDNFIKFITLTANGQSVGTFDLSEPGDTAVFVMRLNTVNLPDADTRLEAVAYDRIDARGLSRPVVVRVANRSPNVGPIAQIVSPQRDEELGGIVQIAVQPDFNERLIISRVDFLVDGVAVNTTTSLPWVYDWDTSLEQPGPHVVQARVYSGTDAFRLTDPVPVTVVKADEGTVGAQCETVGCIRIRRPGLSGEVRGAVGIGFNNNIYVATLGDTLHALFPDGTPRWKRGANGPMRGSPVVGNNEDLFVTSQDGRVYAYSATGSLLWSFNTGALLRGGASLGIDGTLYVGDSNGRLHALNSFNGTQRAGFPIQVSTAPITNTPVIARDRTVFIASTDGIVYAFGPTGQRLWQSSSLGTITEGMALAEREVTINLPSGNTRTTVTSVYVVSANGSVSSLAGATGNLEWFQSLPGPARSGPIVGPDGAIYVGTTSGLVALNEDAVPGTPRLRYIYPADDVGTPVIDSNGIIYFVARQTLFALNLNGTPLWRYELRTTSQSPLTIDRRGNLYVAGDNRILFAFNTTSTGLANEKWPTFQRNARRTGRIGADSVD